MRARGDYSTRLKRGKVGTTIKADKIAWPKTLREQVRTVLELLKTETLSAEQIAARFKGLKAPKLGELLQTLVDMGRARGNQEGVWGVNHRLTYSERKMLELPSIGA